MVSNSDFDGVKFVGRNGIRLARSKNTISLLRETRFHYPCLQVESCKIHDFEICSGSCGSVCNMEDGPMIWDHRSLYVVVVL